MVDHWVVVAPVQASRCSFFDGNLLDTTRYPTEQAIIDGQCGQRATTRLTSTSGHTATVCGDHLAHVRGCPQCQAWLHTVDPIEPDRPNTTDPLGYLVPNAGI